MATEATVSPFQCGGSAYSFRDEKLLEGIDIRIEAGSFLVLIKIGNTPAAAQADYYLQGGEALTISKYHSPNGKYVQIINITGDPKIYWHQH